MVQKQNTAEKTVPVRASTQDLWTSSARQKLVEAVEQYDLASKPEWSVLDELSSATEFEGLQVFAEDAIFYGSGFVAPATVYVKLHYGSSSDDPADFSESFPASVNFDVKPDGTVEIDRIEVDTKSFFGDEEA